MPKHLQKITCRLPWKQVNAAIFLLKFHKSVASYAVILRGPYCPDPPREEEDNTTPVKMTAREAKKSVAGLEIKICQYSVRLPFFLA